MRSKGGFVEQPEWTPGCWVDVERPDSSDLEFLSRELRVPEEFLEYIGDPDERPRVERQEGWMLAIIRVAVRSDDPSVPFVTVPVGIIAGGKSIVTVCHRSTELTDDFIGHTRRKGIDVDNVANFILRLVFSATYWYLEYLKEINEDVSRAEKELERSVRNNDLLAMMKLQKTLVYFSTSIQGNEMLLGRVAGMFGHDIDTDLLEDVQIELKQADNTVRIYSDILESVMDASASIISNNVNDIMKRLTSVSVILMVPTLIASFYGMNVAIGLEDNPYAFWIIMAGAAVLTLLAYLMFRHSRWF